MALPKVIIALVGSLAILNLGNLANVAKAQFRNATQEWNFSGASKAAFADFDNDGFVDVYTGTLLRNISGKKFEVVKDSGIGSGEGIWGDYNNDGKLDLFLFTGAGALYKNLGGSKFEKVDFPEMPTVNSRGAVWVDLNNDSFLDLYVGGYEIWQKKVHPDVVFMNQKDGTFSKHWQQKDCFSARGVTAADFNEDGFADVFVSNYRLQPNFLLESDGKGNLKDVTKTSNAIGTPSAQINYTGGIKYPMCGHTIGSCFGDLDNDGHLDLFVGNFSHPNPAQNRPEFLKNLGPKSSYQFEDRSKDAGLAWQESFASPTLGDFDNDGDLDLFFTTVYAVGSGGIKNFPVLYRNNGGWKFEDVTQQEKLGQIGATYQAAWADVDNDGDLDLATAGAIYLNDAKRENFLKIRLVGDGTKVNATGVGAIVRIKVGDQTLTRQVESGVGEGNQNELQLHFGLGNHSANVDVEVTWPGKIVQVAKQLKVNQSHKISFQE